MCVPISATHCSQPTFFINVVWRSSLLPPGMIETRGMPKFRAKAVPWKLLVTTKSAFIKISINSSILDLL